MGWYKEGLQVTIELMRDRFWGQINIAAFDIGLNIFFKAWPVLFLADELYGFINFEMTCQRIIVMPANKLCSNDFKHKQ